MHSGQLRCSMLVTEVWPLTHLLHQSRKFVDLAYAVSVFAFTVKRVVFRPTSHTCQGSMRIALKLEYPPLDNFARMSWQVSVSIRLVHSRSRKLHDQTRSQV